MKNFSLNHFSKFDERQEKKKKLQDVEDVQENINLNRQKKSSSEPSMVKIDSWNENLNGWLFQCLFG
jgi:hypothetical protein